MLEVRVGDKVAEGGGHKSRILTPVPRIFTIVRLTKTMAILDDDRRVNISTGCECGENRFSYPHFFRLATPEDIAAWEEYLVRRELLQTLRGITPAQLTTDQLRQIVAKIESFTEEDNGTEEES